MKRLVYIIVFALGLTACYDDKGSYDYHDICATFLGHIVKYFNFYLHF